MHPDMADYAERVRRQRGNDWPCQTEWDDALKCSVCVVCGARGDCRLPEPGPQRDAWLEGRRLALAEARRDA